MKLLYEVMSKIPRGYSLVLSHEPCDDDGGRVLPTAILYRQRTGNEDAVVWGVNAEHMEAFERLLLDALTRTFDRVPR